MNQLEKMFRDAHATLSHAERTEKERVKRYLESGGMDSTTTGNSISKWKPVLEAEKQYGVDVWAQKPIKLTVTLEYGSFLTGPERDKLERALVDAIEGIEAENLVRFPVNVQRINVQYI